MTGTGKSSARIGPGDPGVGSGRLVLGVVLK